MLCRRYMPGRVITTGKARSFMSALLGMIRRRFVVLAVAVVALNFISCRESSVSKVGTPELRDNLVDTILARTEQRESFSTIKNEKLRFEPLEAMASLRETVVSASTEDKLYYALVQLSNARRDRHLDISLVPGGLRPADVTGLAVWGDESSTPLQSPVRVFPDYTSNSAGYFVGDIAAGKAWPELPKIGDRVVSVNGRSVEQWYEATMPFMRHSTQIGLRWKLAEAMTQATAVFPPELREATLQLTVESKDGSKPSFTLPYVNTKDLTWTGSGDPQYPGLSLGLRTPTYDLFLSDDSSRFIVLVWYGFRETMVTDVDTLIELAERDGLLDYAVVVDVTRSGGGSLGAYALQRLLSRPFKTTFGNLRLSDVIEPFVEAKRSDFSANNINDNGAPETIDDGTWLMEWLEEDVLPAFAHGDEYSNDVPFKLAHAPKDSDGVLEPAPVHFRGPFGVISGPNGGSHLDQFISIVVDNGLGPVVGMAPGGYSNTWEWEEVLTFADTDQPVVGCMYSIGHTIRPNGEVLEGNPAAVDEWIPLTAENVKEYYSILLEQVRIQMGMVEN